MALDHDATRQQYAYHTDLRRHLVTADTFEATGGHIWPLDNNSLHIRLKGSQKDHGFTPKPFSLSEEDLPDEFAPMLLRSMWSQSLRQ